MRKIAVYLSVSFWPLSLFFANTRKDFWTYLLPVILLLMSFFIYKKGSKFYQTPLLFVPLMEPKLSLFPIIFLLIDWLVGKKEKTKFAFLIISIVILILLWKPFKGQTVFIPDYEAQQEVIRETHLYSSIPLARTFHNKLRIITDKFTSNFFALTDTNNYFFGFAPRQTINNQNLSKFPFLGIIFALYGIFLINKNENKKFVITAFLAGIISLSILTIFDRNDFILWVPLSLILIHGINSLAKNFKFSFWLFIAFIVFAFPELVRIFVVYLK